MTLPDGIGIDVGSTTIKVVAARGDEIVYRAYARHRGDCLERAREALARAARESGVGGPRFVTGSTGSALASALDATYVHEVHAAAAAVRARFPAARTVVDLGGQDAKMLHFDAAGAVSSDMNERCAAGTGATLDRCLHRIGLDERALGALDPTAADYACLPVVSAKCGVFAETDLVNLVKAGVPRDRAVCALLDAIVRGNLAVLARGRALEPEVVLLGGPHAFVPALAALWRRHLVARWTERGVSYDDRSVVVPEDAALFAAEGALRCGADRVSWGQGSGRGRLVHLAARPAPHEAARGGAPNGAFESVSVPARRATRAALTLGLDAGSTTIKAVALDEDDALVASVYRRAERDPIDDAKATLAELEAALGDRAAGVRAFGVTGYAAAVLGPVLGADASPVETVAHARACRRFVPDADVVCDVGGQDIKVLRLEGGVVTSFWLSSQCAAGNGVLLEAAARDVGVPLERWADVACGAARVPDLAAGCAVFLDTARVACQKSGYFPAEILAGYARVLPRNVWENVVAGVPLESLGRVFVLSGGVQRNRAALEAHAQYIHAHHPGARVVVHPYPGEAGAIGAALEARDAARDRTRFVGFGRVRTTRFSSRSDASTRCRGCPSACPRTFVDARPPGGRALRLVTGHACERGETQGCGGESEPRLARAENLLRVEAERLFSRSIDVRPASNAARGLRFAMPRALSMYRSAPFFMHYLEAVGARREDLLTGTPTTEALWRRSAGHGTVDACFPVKVAYAHVAELLGERPDVLFFPALTHALTAVRGCCDTASCPVVAGTPLAVRAAFGVGQDGRAAGAAWLTPTLCLTEPEGLARGLFAAMQAVAPALVWEEHLAAIEQARAAQRAFETALERDGAEALGRARKDRHAAIVLLARPYHADPGLHHEIGSELRALGRTTLSTRALPKSGRALDALGGAPLLDLPAEASRLTNSGDGEKLAALRVVAAHPYLVAIELSSFKCGQDASLYGDVASRARAGGRPFLALHDVDETRPVGSLRLRLRTFLHAVERWERGRCEAEVSA